MGEVVYPYPGEIKEAITNCNASLNFGLWYNKFIPLTRRAEKGEIEFPPSDNSGDKNRVSDYYRLVYQRYRENESLKRMLILKHIEQIKFCEYFSERYLNISITAALTSRLITGIGESHPHEISMVFDRNLGIPYIPASGIKGLVRLAHTIDIIMSNEITGNEKGEFNDEDEKWNICRIFGTQNKKGKVIFLDAYPLEVPELETDIVNPHYGKYYSGEDQAPADYLDPNPIKFLTLKKAVKFTFRALVPKGNEDLLNAVKTSYVKALTEEGIGAKKALGYGMFVIESDNEDEELIRRINEEEGKREAAKESERKREEEQRLEKLTPDERMLEEIRNLPKNTDLIAKLLQRISGGTFSKEVFISLKKKLIDIQEWEPYGKNKNKIERMTERNSKIEARINA